MWMRIETRIFTFRILWHYSKDEILDFHQKTNQFAIFNRGRHGDKRKLLPCDTMEGS